MEDILLKEIISVVNGNCSFEYQNIPINSVSIDSRKIKKGDLYFALQGEVFDGHDFVNHAALNGAVAAIVSKSISISENIPLIRVDDTLDALWKLSSYYRQKLSKPVIAITGSVGKTSTKDMIASILSAKYNAHKSQGNFNNHIGMPLTILELQNKHEVMILEMGMRGLGEIRDLTNIAKPSIAVITNIGISHIERLGSQENILKAKLEIVDGLDENGVLILNANDPMLSKIDKNIAHKVINVGIEIPADYTAYSVVDLGEDGVSFKIVLDDIEYGVVIPAVGVHNVYNTLIGIACGIEMGMSADEIILGIKNYVAEKMRLNIIEKKGVKIINDSYNSSPDSMSTGLNVLKKLAGHNRSIAIIGSMLELGEMSAAAHYDVGKMCRELDIDFCALIGENSDDVAKGIANYDKFKIFNTHDDIAEYMKENSRNGDVVLIKGSRGMNMEKVLELW